MERAVLDERIEITFGFAAAVIAFPGPADGEFVEAQHVHDADMRQTHTEKLRSLGHACTHKKPAVAAAADGELGGGSVLVLDEPFSRRDEIIEHVLLVLQATRIVPLGAILAATPEVGERVDTSHFKPREGLHAKAWRQRDVKPAIAIEQRGVLAIQLQALLVHQEHGDLNPIL